MLNLKVTNNKEDTLIQEICLPLTLGSPMALGLKDDIALIGNLLVKTDSIVEGTHYKKGTPPWKVARKLLARNLSDLAAKGATPKAYVLSVILPQEVEAAEFLRDFAKGLTAGFPLIGGDVSTTQGSLFSANITIFGEPTGEVPHRFNAKVGDFIYVTGKLGGAFLGFKGVPEFLEYYELPQPKLALGQKLVREHQISAMMDISDGLLLDLTRILKASGCGAEVSFEAIPTFGEASAGNFTQTFTASADKISGQASGEDFNKSFNESFTESFEKTFEEKIVFTKEELITFGDDYELLFTSPRALPPELATKIGVITKEESLKLSYKGNPPNIKALGFSYFT